MAKLSNFTSNGSGGNGGAIFVSFSSAFNATGCHFALNGLGTFPSRHGGAIFVDSHAVTFIEGCTFDNNIAYSGGSLSLTTGSVAFVHSSRLKLSETVLQSGDASLIEASGATLNVAVRLSWLSNGPYAVGLPF